LFRKPAFIIMLFLLVISALALAYNVQPVNSDYVWTETIYIRADGSIDPSTAPISSVNNVTYTLTDNIAGNVLAGYAAIIIGRDNTTIDGAGYTLQGPGASSGAGVGIDLVGRSNVTIKNMKVTAFDYGIYISYSSSNNSVSGNNITANYWAGINLYSSSNNSVSGNNITNNVYGIWLYTSSNNSVSGNNMANNGAGTYVYYYSNNNSVSANNMANNEYGIDLYSSSNNTIYHNNFINNTSQVYSSNSTNVWDDGYASGGNYWSNYNGPDLYSGPHQNQTGSDGIGDTPYIIDGSNRDHYPLIGPWATGVTRYPWPMFHNNPTHTGYTESPGPQTNQTRWVYSAGGSVYSSPAVVNGRVYFGSMGGYVYCLDAMSGGLIWNYMTEGDVYSSPAVVDGKVYVGSEDHKVYCLDASSGAFIWSYATGYDVLSSPAVVNGKVYVGSRDNKIYCLDALSGGLIWNYTTGSLVDSSPAIACGRVYFGSTDGKVYCLDALTGAVIWTYQTYSPVTSSPAVVDAKVYIGSGPINSSLPGKVYCLDGLTGALVWSSPLGPYGYILDSCPAVANGRVYVGSMDNRIYCLAASTGEQLWNYTATVDYSMQSSPAVVDGKVYVGSEDDNVYCLDALSGAVIWKYRTYSYVFSSPAVADGVVFIGSWDHCVYAIGSVIRVPEDYKTIQGAINAANPGDTIVVGPSVYHESLIINKTLTILGRMGSEPAFVGGGSGIAMQLLHGASGTVVADVQITNWAQGILIVNASNCRIYATTMSQMSNNAIALTGTNAIGNQIYSNIFQSNAVAVNLTASSTGNAFYNNIIVSNTIVGLNLQSNGNTIYANTISQNQIGINMTNSNSNTIYHNNFIDNTIQANILASASNTWDDGYPSGGNCWSGYTGQDYKSGPYQNETGSDGIGDTSYAITVNSVDRYPLMKPFNPCDIGIASLYTERTVVCQGYNISISVRILNYGISNEIFTLTINASAAIIGIQTIALPSRNCTTITLTWNTAGYAKGNYTLSACATSVPEETDTKDNNFTGRWIVVSMVGDLTGGSANAWDFVPDGLVDGSDLSIVAKCYGSWPDAQPPMIWNVNCDVTNDGVVDGSDLSIIARHFGEGSP